VKAALSAYARSRLAVRLDEAERALAMAREIVADCQATDARGEPLSPEQLEGLRLVEQVHEALENGHELPQLANA
jgi:hypothetical protein